ncbi:hypothetical protein [Nostoc sphaeroides]|uniref:Uncharacterized protein n=1 Tax=Nostoc sphaeroides CCNUC1 TaxID=2653204 RepID=A0A5P8VW29_9NOSO|nr:hypothetical protein [Nostoc sphaeroides]QFS44632.1 hypothetical protein GXM_02107 [Nostoc sphaeroides CCNUC1]
MKHYLRFGVESDRIAIAPSSQYRSQSPNHRTSQEYRSRVFMNL